ncbi:Na+/H+ antiporter NhaC family protein [Anaerolentibacter hominis]|uniref:Na+/H+ antiporter NhaC family protein n=1 Tax=Anaerolentibacter hominis TaxID=3079009 RepID=UPI0031B818DB
MDVVISFLIFFAALIASIIWKFSILIPLAIGLAAFIVAAVLRGNSVGAVIRMMGKGLKSSVGVVFILFLLGVITALWRSAGTIPYIVYHSVRFIQPQIFIVCVFLLCCLFSYLTGSTLGTAGTIGVVMMVLARTGGVDLYLTAGAVLSGGVFGDRNSPFSNSANLISNVTKTNIYVNIKNMFRDGLLPILITLGIYIVFSLQNPLRVEEAGVLSDMPELFRLHWIVLLPAVLVLVLSFLRIKVKYTLLISVLTSFILSLTVQHQSFGQVLKYIWSGYTPAQASELGKIMSGGGLSSMVTVLGIVLLSSTYSGIFDATGMLHGIEDVIIRFSRKLGAYVTTLVSSFFIACFSCNQTLSTMMTYQLCHKANEAQKVDKYDFALCMENSVVLIAGLLPWSIACAAPLAAINMDYGAIRYEFLPFLIILINLIKRVAKLPQKTIKTLERSNEE